MPPLLYILSGRLYPELELIFDTRIFIRANVEGR